MDVVVFVVAAAIILVGAVGVVLRGNPVHAALNLVMTLFGVAVLFEHQGILSAILRRTLLRNVAKDSAEMERVVMASGLDWTIVRPPRLTNGPLTRRYGVSDDRMPRGARLTVSRADVAHFLLEELEHRAHIHRIVGVASVKGSASQATAETRSSV